ncbi:MAG: GNAT family N-acetyltransferase [Gammaproteobacteria bacterium]|jgi:ribosomal protein S18 acetylase RimI-like enzyme
MKLSSIRRSIKNGLVLDALLWRIERVGITIEPYYVFEERIPDHEPNFDNSILENYHPGFFDKSDLDDIDFFDESTRLDDLYARIEFGGLCFGLKQDDKVVAYMWCDLSHFNHAPCRHELDVDQAYLYDARVSPCYRGKGLAVYMRLRCYKALKRYSKSRFLSYSDFSNTPAIRFKEKLGARRQALYVYVNIYGRLTGNWLLKEYFLARE